MTSQGRAARGGRLPSYVHSALSVRVPRNHAGRQKVEDLGCGVWLMPAIRCPLALATLMASRGHSLISSDSNTTTSATHRTAADQRSRFRRTEALGRPLNCRGVLRRSACTRVSQRLRPGPTLRAVDDVVSRLLGATAQVHFALPRCRPTSHSRVASLCRMTTWRACPGL